MHVVRMQVCVYTKKNIIHQLYVIQEEINISLQTASACIKWHAHDEDSCSDINRPEIQSQEVHVNILIMPSRMLDIEQN